jgi:Domain of unknown function (DUF4388)
MSSSDFGPEADADEALTLKGRIEDSSVPELMRSILSSGETGVFTFRNGDVTKSVFMHMGRVVYARSSDIDERLGESLLARGKITMRHYLEASQLIRPGRRLGTILVEMGALGAEDLLPAIEAHVREILLDVFVWTRGEYELVMNEPSLDDILTLNISIENLILEGIRRTNAWSRIFRGIGGLEAVPVPTGNTDVLYKLSLTDDEQEILAHVNGRSQVEQICQVSYLSNFETCRILWALQVLGVIRREQAGAEAIAGEARAREGELDTEAVVEKFNQMLNRIYVFLKGRNGDEVDDYMAAALERVTARYEALFYGIDLRQYGRADYDQMLANVADLPADDRKELMTTGLRELVAAIQALVREHQGVEEAAVVSGIIKDGYRRLGVS